MERLPVETTSSYQIKELLIEKANHYESLASNLMRMNKDDESSSSLMSDQISALTFSPRSPLSTASNSQAAGDQRFFFSPDDVSSPTQPSKQGETSSFGTAITRTPAIDTAVGHANAKLTHALDLDEGEQKPEAISMYMQAAELYLQAIQLCKKQQPPLTDIADSLKKRLQQTLERLEELKQPRTFAGNSNTKKSSQPSDSNSLTQEEIQVLKKSSLIASGLFLPWSERDAQKLASDCGRSPLFTDPDGYLPLSTKQKERFHCWARPSEILRLRQQHAVLGSVLKSTASNPVMVKAITPYTIQQKYVTDCSFIASLCICATYERRFRKQLITSILHPQDSSGQLLYNPSGKYMVKLWLNGVARCVVIDDYLPIDKHGNLLCSQTTHNSASSLELWVCLIEKAYMKLCGGYDFPGSNSGVDLFSLTGWIPERVLFAKDPENVKDFETPVDRAWDRIYSASSYGDCLITVSTQLELTESEADAIGLVTGHAYAVLAVIQTQNGTRLLQLKNPWAHKGWKGRYSSHDKSNWNSMAFRKEVGYDPDIAAKLDDGVFWICWEDILHYFQNFHLSWNPTLFRSRLTAHGCWPKDQGPSDDTFNIGDNPQYTLTLSDKAIKQRATIWILISRHVTKQEQEGNEVRFATAVRFACPDFANFYTIANITPSPRHFAQAKDYLTLHIHRNNANRERMWYPGRSGNCVLTGCYTNNPHVLVRYDVQDESDKYLTLVLSQYKKSNDLNYTLSCFCTEDFLFGKPEKDLQYHSKHSLSWSTYTAGGPVGQDNFINNPQFSVSIPVASSLQLKVSTATTVAANAMLVPVRAYGDGVDWALGEPVMDSGKYRHGFVVTEKATIKPGSYALIVSNFHAGQTGLFDLKVSSSSGKVKIEKINR